MEICRRGYELSGLVQGVGLRYLARHAAAAQGLTGWVRNCADGSVLLELQGSGPAIDRAMDSILTGRWVRVEELRRRELPVDPEERSFRVLDDAW